jgi:hypothetical protein
MPVGINVGFSSRWLFKLLKEREDLIGMVSA